MGIDSTPSSVPDDLTLGIRLRRVRQAIGIDQARMAELMGFKASSAISKIENGHRRLSATELRDWCRICTVSPDAVLAGDPITVRLSERSA